MNLDLDKLALEIGKQVLGRLIAEQQAAELARLLAEKEKDADPRPV